MVRNVMKKGLLPDTLSGENPIGKEARGAVCRNRLGISRGAVVRACCRRGIAAEGRIPADRDGLAQLVLRLGAEVKGCVEMMSGAVWVRDELCACGWQV